MFIKKAGKGVLCRLLETQVKRLRQKNQFKIVAVAGSVGKTSTKLAIARTLAVSRRVQYQNGNYNDRLTVPLVLFGEAEPSIFNVFAWALILLRNEIKLRKPYPYDAAVLELGTDGPGQLRDFAYLQPELTVITAIAPEHMEYFKTLDAVAEEELLPLQYSQQVLLNQDDVPLIYRMQGEFTTYGLDSSATYTVRQARPLGVLGQELSLCLNGQDVDAHISLLGTQGAKIALAAAAASQLLELPIADSINGLQALQPVPGRMQILRGIKQATLIDDTYNASPVAVTAALEVLYGLEAKQRIAILGSMNELGEQTTEAHQQVGAACDSSKLSLVVTVGVVAQEHLAPAAQAAGCQVQSFLSPYEAGDYVKQQLHTGAAVLAKGSQNGVFAEEALKPLLQDPAEAAKLVRQSPYWLKRKHQEFDRGSAL